MKKHIQWLMPVPTNQPLRIAPWREKWHPSKHSILNACIVGVAGEGKTKSVLYLLVDDPLLSMPADPYLGDIVRIAKEPECSGDPYEFEAVNNLVDPIAAAKFRKQLDRERKSIERIKRQHEAGKYSPAIAPPSSGRELRYLFAVIRNGWRWLARQWKRVITK